MPRKFCRERLGGSADVVFSDMAANATGHRKTDHFKIMGLVEVAAEFAKEILNPGGAFRREGAAGRNREELLNPLKRYFERKTCQTFGQPLRILRNYMCLRPDTDGE